MPHGDITHIDIPVADQDKAAAFYADLFGWQIAAPPGFEEYPMWRAPNQISGGGLAPRGADFTQPRSYVEVDSIDETLAKAERNGGAVAVPKTPISETSWFAVLRDPDGNDLGVYEGVTET
ncbi:MAG: VOC family protein [Nocardioides sp.]|uniref:VOC family protein n=1 Tax=Nocardioides sp. TaxID=35761 RepID=UPI0039E3C692